MQEVGRHSTPLATLSLSPVITDDSGIFRWNLASLPRLGRRADFE